MLVADAGGGAKVLTLQRAVALLGLEIDPPDMSSEPLNSKFLRESPHGLALIPHLPLGTMSCGQSQKNHVYRVLSLPGLWAGQVSEGGVGVEEEGLAEK